MQLQKANGQPSRGPQRKKKKAMVRNTLRMKVQEEKNFTLHSLKTLLTSEPQVAQHLRENTALKPSKVVFILITHLCNLLLILLSIHTCS